MCSQTSFKLTAISLILGISSFAAIGQNNTQLLFKSGVVLPTNHVSTGSNGLSYDAAELVGNKYYRLIQFSTLPSQAVKEELVNNGVKLLNYIPNNAYFAEVDKTTDIGSLKAFNVTHVMKIKEEFKLSNKLAKNDFQEWAVSGSSIQLNAVAFEGVSKEIITNELSKIGATVILVNYANIVHLQIEKVKLNELYQLPFIHYFEQIESPTEPENLPGMSDHRSNNLATSYFSGLKYDGTGITVMLQDNSALDEHIDYTGRFTNTPSATNSGDHGEHCGGTIAGAGNIDPTARGMAYGADVLVYGSNNNNFNDVPTIYANDNVTITSKSYSNGTNAGYTTLAQQLDQQVRQLPSLIHVFSAGNAGTSNTTPAGAGWYNITGGHKAGKNVITCANLTQEDVVANSSSRGPCEDGRIKPDISAVGTNVWSTHDPNDYVSKTGTSMSCPGVAGTLAQLYHAYKDLNSGNNPPSGLIKALVLNTADDLGNAGPDFIYGWGRINARRAFDVMDNNQYITGTMSNGGNNTHNITVPPGTDQLRVMVLWVDYEGAANASPALVNDLNMFVQEPSTATFNPWVLDPTPNATNLNSTAIRGVDDLNNMEQVTIDNPQSGVHVVDVSGFSVPQGPQTYYVVYEFVTDDVVLTYPIGGEGIDSDVNEIIRWDALGNTGTFDLDYSDDNGASWSNIVTGVSASDRFYNWNVPAGITGEALVRVTRGASTSQSHTTFSVIQTPTNLQVNWACPDSMNVSWNPIPGATGYEVSLLGNKYMDSVGTAIGTNNLTIPAPSNIDHWWSVKALSSNNCEGRRALAVFQSSGTFSCVLPTDLELTSSVPSNGSQLSSCMMASPTVTITIKNNGLSSLSNIPVHYQLNGNTAINETVAGPLAAGASMNYTFTVNIIPIVGNNTLITWNTLVADGNRYNDTLNAQFVFASSPLKSLPWSEDFEGFTLCPSNDQCGADVCVTSNEFMNDVNGLGDDIDWLTDDNGTASNNTGPTTDFKPGTTFGKYMYLEATDCFYSQANLISPCIDLTNASSATLTFAYHLYGFEIGELHVDILVNGVWTNDITTIVGHQGNQWLQEIVSLTPYLGNVVNFRFRGITGSGYRSDMAIDDISVTGTVSLDEIELSNSFNLHPNPSDGIFNFEYLGATTGTAKVIDVNGKVVFEKSLGIMDKGTIDLTNQADGIYLLMLSSEDNVITKKLIKR